MSVTETIHESKVYRTTKDKCQSMISGVCSCCGGELKPMETVDNSDHPTYWAGCEACNRFDWGIPVEIFQIAKFMVEKRNYVHYSHIDKPGTNNYETPEYADYYTKIQIAGTASMISEILRVQRYIREGKPL